MHVFYFLKRLKEFLSLQIKSLKHKWWFSLFVFEVKWLVFSLVRFGFHFHCCSIFCLIADTLSAINKDVWYIGKEFQQMKAPWSLVPWQPHRVQMVLESFRTIRGINGLMLSWKIWRMTKTSTDSYRAVFVCVNWI